MPRATAIFRMLEKDTERTHIHHEFACAEFSRVRRGMRTVIRALIEDESFAEEAERLRHLLFAWLTTPLPFSEFDSAPLLKLGNPDTVSRLWGRDVMEAYISALDSISELRTMTSPLRAAVENALVSNLGSGTRTNVYCHRSARAVFTSMYGWAELEEAGEVGFLHTPRDYRVAEPFDILIKIGPLRRTGYSSLTGAVINAPRYRSLQQFTWSGLPDDEGFGRDPLLSALRGGGEGGPRSDGSRTREGIPHWHRSEVRSGVEDLTDPSSAELGDELTLFSRAAPPRSESRPAILIQIGDDLGVLYPPSAEVIALRRSPSGSMEVAPAIVSSLMGGNNFLAWPDLGEVDLGGAHATDGAYSAVWKNRLAEYLVSRPNRLERELRREGLDLRHLQSCLEHWAKPASSVIHAPQQRQHFQILVRVLEVGNEPAADGRRSQAPWWLRAWAEIARSRGHAVQVGMQEQEIIQGELMAILNSESAFLAHAAEEGRTFSFPLSRAGLEGQIIFYHIEAIESGYRVPGAMLKTIASLEGAYEWRV